MSDQQKLIFHDEAKARKWLESQVWPDGPYCPRCGSVERIRKLKGKAHRPGLYQCQACQKQFSATVGTLLERSHVPLHKWLLCAHLLCAGKKGTSSHQIHRMLGVTYKTAWFMTHRLREAMRDHSPSPLGGANKVVEADETYVGSKAKNPAFDSSRRNGASAARSCSDRTGNKNRSGSPYRSDGTGCRSVIRHSWGLF